MLRKTGSVFVFRLNRRENNHNRLSPNETTCLRRWSNEPSSWNRDVHRGSETQSSNCIGQREHSPCYGDYQITSISKFCFSSLKLLFLQQGRADDAILLLKMAMFQPIKCFQFTQWPWLFPKLDSVTNISGNTEKNIWTKLVGATFKEGNLYVRNLNWKLQCTCTG
jgi:hypothetical protein